MNRERALEVLLVVVGLIFSGLVYPSDDVCAARTYVGDDADRLCRHFPAAGGTQPVRESQPDCFHGMVEFCPWCGDGGAGIP